MDGDYGWVLEIVHACLDVVDEAPAPGVLLVYVVLQVRNVRGGAVYGSCEKSA